jgi:NADPH2:quinone reductase
MRAVVVQAFGPVEQLALGELAEPMPQAGEVLVEVRATGVNYVDLLVIGGKYQFLPQVPFAPGKLPAGVVVACGPGVSRLKPGDRVLTLAEQGGYAERIAVPDSSCILLPADLSFVDAAAMALAYDTAWFALVERARYSAGESVLVLGASGAVGLAALQLARAFGARVLAGIANSAHADLVREAGADAIIDLSGSDLHDRLRADVGAATGGNGVNIVLDMLGIVLDMLGSPYFEAALRALAWRGRLVVVGFAAGTIPSVRANYLLVKNIEVSGLQISDYRKRMPDLMERCFRDIFDLYGAGKLRPPAHRVYGLADFAQALTDLQDRSIRERIVLAPTGAGRG